MIDAQVRPAVAGAILVDAAQAATLDETWFDADHWRALGVAEAQPGGRGGVTFAATPAGACALRHYRRGGVAARFSADRYLWTGAGRTRAFREFRLLARLVDGGLPVPAPIAARYRRDGVGYRADLLMRRIAPAETLAERLAARTLGADLARRVGNTIARFHAAHVWHADLNANNILIDAAHDIWLIDFDRGQIRAPKLAWQQGNLKRLRRSLDKLGARRVAGFDEQFWHPLLAAYHAGLSHRLDPAGIAP